MKNTISQIYSDMVYDGKWFTELRSNIDAMMNDMHKFTTGEVRVKLHKGNCIVTGRRSEYSLYDFDLATYSTDDIFEHTSATGFIDIFSLPSKTQAKNQTFYDSK